MLGLRCGVIPPMQFRAKGGTFRGENCDKQAALFYRVCVHANYSLNRADSRITLSLK